MKKGLLVLLSAFLLLFTACDSWMQDDEFYDDIENEVKVANAQQISVFVRYAMTRQGKTDPDGPATFKVEIPHSISATTEPEFGFVRWAAFSTEFLETGNNQSKNKDVYFIDYEDYNARLLPKEIKSPVVVFEDATNPTTTVTINENRNDIFLVPIVAQRPTVSLTIPAKGSSGVVRNMSVRINFTKPMDEDSFKNSEGVFDKITVTQGIQTFTTDGDIEISSVDITDRFEAPVFSANKKMVTLRFNQESISEGYDSQSSVNIIISKDVKDIFGFAMTDDDKISFSVGSSMDTLAPRITFITAGTTLTNFDTFKGMYKDAATWGNITAFTKMDPHQKGSGQTATYLGAKDAPVNNLDSSFYDTFAPPADASNSGYRITDKIYIHALAEDIAGSGSNQNQTGIETDVAMLGVRATLMYNADGTVPDASATNVTIPTTSVNYMPQSVGQSLAKDYVYKNLVHAINVKNGTPNASDEGYIAEDKGFLFEYDLSSLPDGLIRVDIFAVDMVQNSGLAAGGELSEEYGNGYASIFVVKDTTAPDATANSGHVIVDTGADSHITADNYFNEVTYSRLKIKGDTSSIVDYGHPRLRSHHDNMKWIVKPTDKTDWVSSIKTTDSSWGAITSNYGPFPNPGNEGKVFYTYALMDDVGNISNAVGINPIYYDSVAPEVQVPYFVADEGFTAGVAKDNVLNEQTLVIPVKEITSGLKSIELKVRKNGATVDYATPLADSSLAVVAKDKDGNEVPYTVDSAKKVITFNQPITDFDSNVTIKGLKLSDDLDEQGSFEINVLVKDAAAADSVHETTPTAGVVSNTDSVPVQINTVYIPNIRKTERLGVANSAEYWIDYNASTLTKRAGSNPLTDVYITFTEATSGAKIFDFTGSSITLTDDANGNGSKIYKVNAENGTIDGIAIPSTVSGNKLIINSSVDAKNYFANPNGEHKLTVKISNVALANEGTDSTIALKIYDTATNGSASGSTICSNEGSLNLVTPGISTPKFKFDSINPTSAMDHGYLVDRNGSPSDSTATAATGKTVAEPGYTNEDLINATVTLNPKASGISSLRIDGDATFVSGTTTIKANGTDVSFDISSEGKVVTFKNANGHLALGSGTTAVTLTITNLKLTSGDGTKNVTFLARGFGNVEDTTGSSDYIILDTVPPVWVNNGLYSAYNSSVTSTTAYPHPISGEKAYGFSGIDTDHPDELYFYRYEKISIKPDVSDDNPKAETALIDYTHDGSVVENNNAAYSHGSSSGYTTDTGTFTATAKDRAGNMSTVKTFHIVADTSFASDDDCSKIDQYMTLYKPAGAFIHRNKTKVNDITEYVIKGTAQYQIHVKLGGATTESDSNGNEETIDKPGTGATPLLTTPYVRKDNTISSSKIESYYISTSTFYSSTPTEPSYNSFVEYTSGNTCTNGDLTSTVDDSGTIIINIPTSGTNPIVLWLRDGCGNVIHRKIRPTSMATDSSLSAIRWLVDTEIGVTGYKGSLDTSLPSVTKKDDVTFYNDSNTPTLTVSGLSESCRFEIGENETVTNVGDENHYSLKSRIIVWTGSGSPTRDDFYADSLTSDKASAWDYRKQAPEAQADKFESGETIFSITNTFPKYASSNRYKLFFILEDTVGNYYISQLKRDGSNLTTASSYTTAYWLYDKDAPVVDESSIAFQKVNQVTVGSEVRNYYSGNSTVTYNITDSGSGIYHDGSGTTSYPGFDSRRTAITPKTYSIPSVSDGSAPILSGIQDYAGNSRSAITLTNGTSSKWYYMSSAPVLATTTTAVITSLLGDVTPTLSTNTEKFPDSTNEVGGKLLSIKAKSRTTRLDVKLAVSDTTELLGWYISDTPLTNFTTKNFYTKAELTANNSEYDLTPVYNNGFYVVDYNKGIGNYTAWHEHDTFKTPKYYYPVNRAGSIAQTPVKVEFAINRKPIIVNGNNGFTYSSSNEIDDDYLKANAPSTPYTIKTTTESPKINYTRSGATVTFTTDYAPTSCKFVYGAGTNGTWGDDDDVTGTSISLTGSGPTYEIPLDSTELQNHTSSASGTPLRIQLSRGTEEDSDAYVLKGPAANNLWVYDDTTPSISFDADADIKSGSDSAAAAKDSAVTTDTTKYIQNANAFIKFTLEDASFAGTNDIAHFQWKKKADSDTTWSDWADITSGRDGGNLTFAAPAEKTEYMFRAVDTAGNISDATTAVKLQRDDEAPDGTFTYETRKGTVSSSTSTDKKDLTDAGLGPGEGVDNPYGGNNQVRDISYSDSPDSPYYITHIWVNLSGITDNGRSGIQNFIIKKDGIKKDGTALTDETLTSDAGSYRIDLSDNGTSTVEYEVWVTDNINQSRKLQTFRTTVDGDAPVLSNLLIQAKDSNGENESNAVLYPNATSGVYYLKNTKAYITYDIDDAFATYEWSTTGDTNDWHNSNHSPIEASSTNITWTFDAPEEETTYFFRGRDRVKNTSDPVSFKIQKDMWAPAVPSTINDGLIGYTLYNGSSEDDAKTLSDGLVTKGTDSNGDPTVEIKYSSNSTTNGSTNHITRIRIDVSKVSERVNLSGTVVAIDGTGIDRSGIENFYVNGSAVSSIKTNGYYEISLTNGATAESSYIISVKDNAGNERVLRTFTLKPNADLPDFALATGAGVVQTSANANGSDAVNGVAKNLTGATDNGTYYLNKDYAVINFTNTKTDGVTYWVSTDGGTNYSQITSGLTDNSVNTENPEISGTVTYVLPTPSDTAITYKFKAMDEVLNESDVTTAITIKKDSTEPDGTLSYSFNDGAANHYSDDSGTITYNGTYVTDLILDFSNITDTSGSGISSYVVGGSEVNLTNNKYTLNLSTATSPCSVVVKDYAGNSKNFATFILTEDHTAPAFTLADSTEQKTSVQEKNTGSNHNIKTFNNVWFMGTRDNAVVNFDGSYEDSVTYQMKTVVEEESTGLETFANIVLDVGHSSYTFPAPQKPTTYTFQAIDKAGNISEPFSVTISKDTNKPTGDVVFSLKDASGNEIAADDATKVLKSEGDDGKTITLKYNANLIKNIVLTPDISDGTFGSGINTIKYGDNESNTLTNNTANELDISSTTLTITAKDNMGNEETIKTFILKGYSGITVANTQNPPYSGLEYVPTYNPETGRALAKTSANTRPTNGAPDYRIKAFAADSNYSMSNTSTEGTDSSEITIWTYGNSGNDNGWPTQQQNCGWKIRWLDADADTTFTVPFVKDSVPSDMSYALTYHSIVQPTEWTEVAATDIENGKFTVTIDKSKVLYRHTFIFIWYKDAFGNITVYNIVCPDNGKTNQNWWCPASKKDEAPTADDFTKFKYTSDAVYTNIGTLGRVSDFKPTGISTGKVKAGNGNSTSRVSSFFNSVANVFARDSEVVENSVNEKPAETAKKAAKKAKKTAKKAGKKASAKTQVAEKPVMTVETAEIVDETVSVTVPEVTAVAESVVNELTGVTENVKGESEVVTIAPDVEAVVEVEAANQSDEASGKTPSKSAVIVIMLAILSSLGGAWYYQRSRRK